MPKTVDIPGLGIVEFPDSMSDSQILAKARELTRGSSGPLREVLERFGKTPLIPTRNLGSPPELSPSSNLSPWPDPGSEITVADVAETAGPMVLPTAGGVAGAAFGGPIGAAVGAATGEGANQLLGITGPSPEAIAGNFVVPLAGQGVNRAIGATGRLIARKWPGSGMALHDIAKKELEDLSTIFGPQQSSDQLYALVNQFNPRIALPQTQTAVANLLTREQQAAAGLKLPGVARIAKGIQASVGQPAAAAPGAGMDFQDVRVNLRRIGDKIRETREVGGEEHGAVKKIYAAMMSDLETAAAQGNQAMPAVNALKVANAAARREFVTEEIKDIFSKGGLTARPDVGPDAFRVNFGRIAEALRKGKTSTDIKAVLRPAEYERLVQNISDLARQTPNLPPPRGQFAGSAVRIAQAGSGGAMGFLAGPMLGLDPGVGTAVGVMVGTKGIDMMTRMALSPKGRAILVRVLQSTGGIIDSRVAALLSLGAANTETGREVGTGAVELGTGAINLGRSLVGDE